GGWTSTRRTSGRPLSPSVTTRPTTTSPITSNHRFNITRPLGSTGNFPAPVHVGRAGRVLTAAGCAPAVFSLTASPSVRFPSYEQTVSPAAHRRQQPRLETICALPEEGIGGFRALCRHADRGS